MWIKADNGNVFEVDEQTAEALVASATKCEAFEDDPREAVKPGRTAKTQD